MADEETVENIGTEGKQLKTLTLDLGTHVGWTIWDGDLVDSGTFHLASDEELEAQRRAGKERTLDIRFSRLLEFLREKFAAGVGRVVFEDVTFSGSPMQNQLWAGLRSAIWAVAPVAGVAICCVPVTSLKVFATGKTRADKAEMARALVAAEPEAYALSQGGVRMRQSKRLADDNEVDAIWLGRYTAAVDRGERDFLTAYQRKLNKREARRAAKAARRTRKRQKLAEAREKKRRFGLAVKESGRCCGVLRRPAPRGRAVCPKCNRVVKVRIPADQTAANAYTEIVPAMAMPAQQPAVDAA